MFTYDVYTDLPPDLLTEVAKETFRMWLAFALGQQNPTGRMLKNPTGRYAASLSWKMTGAHRATIMADENIAPEASYIEFGTSGADVKQMLMRKFKINKQGEPYRVIPMRPDNDKGPLQFNYDNIVATPGGKGERLAKSVAKIWATPRPFIDKNSGFRTMTGNDKPGWQIHGMPAYAPALLLKAMLDNQYGSGA